MRHRTPLLCLLLALTASLLLGCGTERPDPSGAAAYGRFDLERYFTGHTRAWGLIEPRFGGKIRHFVVDLRGRRDGDVLVLDEDFRYSDGETMQRSWRIRPAGGGKFTGEAADVIGTATGETLGNALHWRYDLRLKTGSDTIDLAFDDWLYRFDDEIVLNRATMSKWGLRVGSLTLAFRKIE